MNDLAEALMPERTQIGFVVVALGGLLFAAWCYAFDRNLDRLEVKVARLAAELADARGDTKALADHLGVEILPAIEDDSPAGMAALAAEDHVHTGWCNHGSCDEPAADETQPIPAQPQPDDGPPTMPDLKKASAVPPPEPNWVEAELADIRARSGRRNAQRPTAKESK